MAVGDENVAVGRDNDVGRRIESVWTVAGDAGLTERSEQPSVRGELHDNLFLAVGGPDGAIGSGE